MAAHGSQMRVMFPKLPEFGQGKKKALSEYLPNKTQQFSEYTLADGLQSAMKFGEVCLFVC